MKPSNFIYALLVLISGHCLAQPPFHYKRNISGVANEGWYTMSLPADIFQHLSPDFSDLRLYALEQKDTLEMPYLLQIRHDEVTSETVHLPLFNKSVREGVLFLSFELQTSQKVNYIDLQFEESNYFGFVTLEGSNDKKEWFEIARDQRIVSVKKNGGDYALSTVGFPLTDYRYLRVAVKADIPLTFQSASFEFNSVKPGVYCNIPATWKMRTDKKARHSFIDLLLGDFAPVSSITVQTDSTGNYYRPFRIEYLRDSAKTEKGWVRYYTPLYEGHLTSFKPNVFNFDWQTAKEIRLVIRDNDNAPLNIRNITAAGPDVQLVSHLKPGENFVLYDADGLRSPSYDLAYFANKIPGDIMVAKFEPAEKLKADEPGTSPLFENKVWLWSLMGLMIGGLGFFTIKMMMKEG